MMDRLDGADREWFERNLAGEANATWIADVLVEGKLRLPNGKALSDGIITRHRRRMCSCWDAS